MIQEFVYANWILVGNGDGTVNLLVPVVEGEQPPDELLVAPYNHITNIQEVARRTEEIAILGCRFAVFPLKPERYRDVMAHSGEDRPLVGLQGRGAEGVWSPLGFPEAWYSEDYRLLLDTANRDSVELRPGVREEAKGSRNRPDPPFPALNNAQTRRRTADAYRQSSDADDQQIDAILQATLQAVQHPGDVTNAAAQRLNALAAELNAIAVDTVAPYRDAINALFGQLDACQDPDKQTEIFRKLHVYFILKAHEDSRKIRQLLKINNEVFAVLGQ
jgi:hypothetical protein